VGEHNQQGGGGNHVIKSLSDSRTSVADHSALFSDTGNREDSGGKSQRDSPTTEGGERKPSGHREGSDKALGYKEMSGRSSVGHRDILERVRGGQRESSERTRRHKESSSSEVTDDMSSGGKKRKLSPLDSASSSVSASHGGHLRSSGTERSTKGDKRERRKGDIGGDMDDDEEDDELGRGVVYSQPLSLTSRSVLKDSFVASPIRSNCTTVRSDHHGGGPAFPRRVGARGRPVLQGGGLAGSRPHRDGPARDTDTQRDGQRPRFEGGRPRAGPVGLLRRNNAPFH